MFTMAKKAALVGMGLSEQAKDVIDELLKKGEESQNKDALRVKSFFDSAEKCEQEACKKMEDICLRVSDRIKLPSCSDIARLKNGLADLEARLHRWETSKQDRHPSASS